MPPPRLPIYLHCVGDRTWPLEVSARWFFWLAVQAPWNTWNITINQQMWPCSWAKQISEHTFMYGSKKKNKTTRTYTSPIRVPYAKLKSAWYSNNCLLRCHHRTICFVQECFLKSLLDLVEKLNHGRLNTNLPSSTQLCWTAWFPDLTCSVKHSFTWLLTFRRSEPLYF